MLLMLNVVNGSVGALSLLILSPALNLSRWKANLQEFSSSEICVPEMSLVNSGQMGRATWFHMLWTLRSMLRVRSCNNLELPSPTLNHTESYKKFDHNQKWTQLPHLDFPKLANTARTTPPEFSQRIDTVFLKSHVDDWKARIKTQIKVDLDKIRQAKQRTLSTRNKELWQKKSDGYRIKLGKHADVQGKGKNIGIKHRTLYLKGSPC